MSFKRYITSFSVLHVWMIMSGVCQNCPEVALLNSTTEITVYVEAALLNNTRFLWIRPSDGDKVVNCHVTCVPNTQGYSGTLQYNTSMLEIDSTSTRDNGMWTLRDIDNSATPFDVCYLVTAAKPSCNINEDTSDLDLGDVLTLTIDTRGYYCSLQSDFSLTTGDVTEMLLQNHTVQSPSNIVLNSTFNVTMTRFGDVTLNFICERKSWELTCGGSQKLRKSRPKCTISSETDTTGLDLDDEVTLTVDITGYYCPEPLNFTLITGDVAQTLLQDNVVDNVADFTNSTTINMTTSEFGDVRLLYTCDGDRWTLDCDGVKQLVQRRPSTTTDKHVTPTQKHADASGGTTTSMLPVPGSTPASAGLPIAIIAGAAAGGLFLISLIVLVIVNRRKLQRVAQKYIVHRRKGPNVPYMEDEIPAGIWPEDSKEGVTNDIKLEPLEETAKKTDEQTTDGRGD